MSREGWTIEYHYCQRHLAPEDRDGSEKTCNDCAATATGLSDSAMPFGDWVQLMRATGHEVVRFTLDPAMDGPDSVERR